VLLLLAQKKNWEEERSSAGKRYRKDDPILLKNADFEKSHPHNALNEFSNLNIPR
jgi:hypothetical protein